MAYPAVNAPTHTAAADRHAREQLRQAISREGTGFEFVQLVRLLQRLYADRAPIGQWADPKTEVVRFHVPPSLAFPTSEVSDVELDEHDAAAAQVGVRFFGLTGPQGVLPHAYTEHAATRARARDTAFREFLDLFHHRALSLFYRSWERHRPMVAAEHGEEDRLHAHLLDLVGAGTSAVQRSSTLPAATMAYYAGLLAVQSRPAAALAQLVSGSFNVPVQIEQFVGEWRSLDDGGQVCIGGDDDDAQLGRAVVGSAVYDAHAKVRLRLGPLTRDQFNAFLPGGRDHRRLCDVAAYFAADEVGVEAQLVLARADVPAASLDAGTGPRLGMGAWIRSRAPTKDADDVLLTLC